MHGFYFWAGQFVTEQHELLHKRSMQQHAKRPLLTVGVPELIRVGKRTGALVTSLLKVPDQILLGLQPTCARNSRPAVAPETAVLSIALCRTSLVYVAMTMSFSKLKDCANSCAQAMCSLCLACCVTKAVCGVQYQIVYQFLISMGGTIAFCMDGSSFSNIQVSLAFLVIVHQSVRVHW